MTVLNGNGDDPVARIWETVAELSDQLSRHRSFAAGLQAQIGVLKNQALHAQTGFPLRRFNLDKSREEYEAELERMTASLAAENGALGHDNKQLAALVREHEQALEQIMDAFRHRAHAVQVRELALVRAHEARLRAREDGTFERSLIRGTSASAALARLSACLRALVRDAAGEDPAAYAVLAAGDAEDAVHAAAWALEREAELARLERENEELKQLLANAEAMSARPALSTPARGVA